jgi:1-acyl-sn-glycerol-3-phosphate acyltransferase
MKSFFRKVYLYYCLGIFSIFFFLFFPLFLIPIIFKSQFKWVGIFIRWWAKAVFTFCFLPFSIESRAQLDSNAQYIFCPNHFSYIDIPAMGLNPHNAIFVGKHDMEKIPLFGFMYRNLHITVDRNKLMSRYTTYKKSVQAIDEGKSLVIFPEGGITTTEFPRMARFKDGAFKLSVDKQIPIVPVTIATNWILLPGELGDLNWHPIRVVFHEPIHPIGKDDISLKKEVFDVIDAELKAAEKAHLNENR